MPTYYDENTKTWYCKFYYTDYTGTKKQKKKEDLNFNMNQRNMNGHLYYNKVRI